jgi:hypothetical protein
MAAFKIIALLFSLAGLASALAAARYWYLASREYPSEPVQSISDVPELHILNTKVSMGKAGALNAKAAIWTGAAAVLSALGSVIGLC